MAPRLFLIVLLSSALCTPVMAQSDPPAQSGLDLQARSLFQAGRIAFEAGRFEQALGYFRQAYELSPRPLLLYNIASSLDRLRRDAEALAAFEQYLREQPDAPNRAGTEARIRVLRQSLQAAQAALPPTPATPETGAQQAPAQPLTADATDAAVAVDAVDARGGSAVRVPDPSTQHALPATAAQPVQQAETQTALPIATSHKPEAARRKYLWTWVAAGSTGVFGGAALLFWLKGGSQYERLNKTCLPAGSCNDQQLKHEVDTSGVRTSDALTNVSLGLSALSMGATVALFVLEGQAHESERPALRALAYPWGLQVEGSF
ncbi:MAG: tetratricopeptide repeat protein [Proteobacteria bacterium]|nr:tetratricopeptide repeat protein [Pseudomonadota bacterium]